MNDATQNSAIATGRAPSPAKAVIYGLLITLVLRLLASTLIGTIVAETSGVDFEDAHAINTALAGNMVFLVTDLLVAGLLMFFAGTIIYRYASPDHIKIAMVVVVITVLVYFYLLLSSGSFDVYPLWYNAVLFFIVVAGIVAGAKRQESGG